MEADKTMHLALNFERNYLTYFYVFITSVFENNKSSNFVFHIISSGLSKQEEADVNAYAETKGSKIIFYE
ncbi:MAG: hypothetical protein EOO60_14400 [Hymenobacter sp.]|nr:MAG: hypothetical protein EOO60_14400 [Hymenobacter sp.]